MVTMINKRIRVRVRDGEQLEWSREAARRSGLLTDLMDVAPPEYGVYPAPLLSAARSAAILSKLAKLWSGRPSLPGGGGI